MTEKKATLDFDLDKVLIKARTAFNKNEKYLTFQLTTGDNIHLPKDDEDFVLFPDPCWKHVTTMPGIPFGKIVEISGQFDSGKSSCGMAFMKSAQDAGHIVIVWDSENKFDTKRFQNKFGGDPSKLVVIRSKVILEGGDMVSATIDSFMSLYPNKKIFVVWDSVGATISKTHNEKSLRDSKQMAQAAKENGDVCRNFVRLMEEYKDKENNKEKIAVLFINQSYAMIGSKGRKEAGGDKVAYHSSVILQLTRMADLKFTKDGIVYKEGILSKVRVKKNHLIDSDLAVAEAVLKITADKITLAPPTTKKSGKKNGKIDWDDSEDEEDESEEESE